MVVVIMIVVIVMIVIIVIVHRNRIENLCRSSKIWNRQREDIENVRKW